MSEHKGREFEVLQGAAELLDTLQKDQQKQAMAMLAARYGFKLMDTAAASGGNYGPTPRRKTKPW